MKNFFLFFSFKQINEFITVPQTDLDHPFHLHGFAFQVFSVGQFWPIRNISRQDINEVIQEHTERLRRGEYKNPPGKDTAKIPMGGYVIVRFKADNPGKNIQIPLRNMISSINMNKNLFLFFDYITILNFIVFLEQEYSVTFYRRMVVTSLSLQLASHHWHGVGHSCRRRK